MRATCIFYKKFIYEDGGIVEMMIWQLPEKSDERPHGLKYSLFYGKGKKRLVGYDNERGKGDHKHICENEYPYTFSTVEQLTADFLADVNAARADK